MFYIIFIQLSPVSKRDLRVVRLYKLELIGLDFLILPEVLNKLLEVDEGISSNEMLQSFSELLGEISGKIGEHKNCFIQ